MGLATTSANTNATILIYNNESGYRQEVEQLEAWCISNNLCINRKKTKNMTVDFRNSAYTPLPSTSEEQLFSGFKYLGVHIAESFT